MKNCSTLFAERNPLVLKEIAALAEREVKEQIGPTSGSGTKFYTLGSMYSQTLGREVHAGLKVVRNPQKTNYYFLPSLVNLMVLEDICPEVSPLSPAFMGGIRRNGEYVALLMEDYSEEGKKRVQTISKYSPKECLPQEIFRALDSEDMSEVSHIFCSIDGKLRMMDFNCLPWNESYEELAQEKRARAWDDEALLLAHSIILS